MGTSLQRRVGLSRFQATSSLLSQLPGRGDKTQESSTDTMAGARSSSAAATAKAQTTSMARKSREPVAVDAPPMSTDDENDHENEDSDGQSSRGLQIPRDDTLADSSEDELIGRSGRGDIEPTLFQSKPQAIPNGRRARPVAGGLHDQTKRHNGASRETRSIGARKKRKLSKEPIEEEDEGDRQGRKGQKATSKFGARSLDHHQTEYGFTKTTTGRSKTRTYKLTKKSQAASESIIDEEDSGSEDRVRFKPPTAENTPLKATTSTSPLNARKLIFPSDDLDATPQSKKSTNGRISIPEEFSDLTDLTDSSDEASAPANKAKRNKKDKKSGPIIRAPRRNANGAGSRLRKPATKGKQKTDPADEADPEDALLSSPLTKTFMVPETLSQLATSKTDVSGTWDISDDSDALSDVPSIISTPSTGTLLELDALVSPAKTTATLCPWCQAPVEKSLLEDFSKGRRLNVRMQTKFCRAHKRQTALDTWNERGYPDVDWQALEGRFAQHRGRLLGIINNENDGDGDGNGPSHYRAKLASRIEAGQARDMKKEENLNPGYYGPRGFVLMCDYLVGEFGGLLKRNAVSDKVIAGRGSAAFIQSVLVAELAVQLIAEDMGVSAEAARDIMEQSKAVGEMVHEEV